MIKTIMTCDKCGKEFYTRYCSGGYIDHVMNFSDHSENISNFPVNRIIWEICWAGNEIRSQYDIRERLNCFKSWNIPDKDKVDTVTTMCEKLIFLLNASKPIAKSVYGKLSPLDRAELLRLLQAESCQYVGFEQVFGCSAFDAEGILKDVGEKEKTGSSSRKRDTGSQHQVC